MESSQKSDGQGDASLCLPKTSSVLLGFGYAGAIIREAERPGTNAGTRALVRNSHDCDYQEAAGDQ